MIEMLVLHSFEDVHGNRRDLLVYFAYIEGGAFMQTYRFSVVLEKDQDGYIAFCPELQGCYTQGETYEEVIENIKDAIRLHVEDRKEAGEEIPRAE